MNLNRIHIHPTVTPAIDFASVETRLTLLELANYARTNQSGTAKFVDSNGDEFTLDAGEIQALVATVHRQMHGGTSK